jgi:uncharacterized protein (DUF433 family)
MKLPVTFTKDEWGLIHVTGHRISLDDLMHYYLEGDSAEMLQARFPTLTLQQCRDAILLYERDPEETQLYLQAGIKELEQSRAKSANRGPGLQELRERREAKRLAPGA